MNYKSFRHFRRLSSPGIFAKYISILSDSIVPIVKTDFGAKFFCPGYIPFWRIESFYLKEPNLVNFIKKSEQKVFWDVGANMGIYSIYAAICGKTVYAFEPNPANYFLLSKNIVLNGLESKIMAFPFAVGETTGTICSKTDCEYGDADIVEMQSDGLSFPLLPPELICDSFSIELPQFLKIDVDGSEMNVLRGIFDSGCGSNVTFASIEHDDKQERHDYMIGKGFSLIMHDYANNYYERKDIVE